MSNKDLCRSIRQVNSVKNIVDLYDPIWRNMTSQEAAETLGTDIRATCGNDLVAMTLSKINPFVYRYVVNSGPSNIYYHGDWHSKICLSYDRFIHIL